MHRITVTYNSGKVQLLKFNSSLECDRNYRTLKFDKSVRSMAVADSKGIYDRYHAKDKKTSVFNMGDYGW